MSRAAATYRCPPCYDERGLHETAFEQPPCEDGHPDCVDLACVLCGHAMSLGHIVGPAAGP